MPLMIHSTLHEEAISGGTLKTTVRITSKDAKSNTCDISTFIILGLIS